MLSFFKKIIVAGCILLVGTVLVPSFVSATAQVGCTCEFAVALLDAQNKINSDCVFSLKWKDQKTGLLGKKFSHIYKQDELFGPKVAAHQWLVTLKEDKNLTLNNDGSVTIVDKKTTCKPFPGAVVNQLVASAGGNSADNLYVVGVDPDWKIDAANAGKGAGHSVCFPGHISDKYSHYVSNQPGGGKYLINMKCNDFDAKAEVGEVVAKGDSDKTVIGHGDSLKSGTGSCYLGVCKLNKLLSTNPATIIGTVIRAMMGILGSIALAMFVFGGVLMMTAAGNADRTKKAVSILVWSSLGAMVILGSYALVSLVMQALV